MEVNSIKKNLLFFLLANSILGLRVCDRTKKKILGFHPHTVANTRVRK